MRLASTSRMRGRRFMAGGVAWATRQLWSIGDETMHCFVRSIDFDALSGRVTWVPVICFGIRAICGRDRGSVEGWGRFVVRLGVGSTKREDVAVGLLLAVHSTVMVGAASAIWLGRKASERKEKHKQTQGRERAERGAERRARPGLGGYRPVMPAACCCATAQTKPFSKPWLGHTFRTTPCIVQRKPPARSSRSLPLS